MNKPINKKLPPEVRNVFKKFQKANQEIYLVGGAVRDWLLKKDKIEDLDFTTIAPPEKIQEIYPRSFYNNQFGTVRIPQKDKKEPLEITTYRSEEDYGDFRHPQKVQWGKSIEEDLKRRDFTINAIALRLDKKNRIILVDPHQGQKDLQKRLVRCVGKPQERFQEDALRLIRAIRFAAKLDFSIEEKTLQAIKQNALLIKKVSAERVRDELLKILVRPHVDMALQLMRETKIIDCILPELTQGYEMKQKGHHLWDVWKHSVMAVKFCPSLDPIVRLATLLHDVGKPTVMKEKNGERTFYNHEVVGAAMARKMGQRLRLSKKNVLRLASLVRWHQFSVSEEQTDSAIKRFIRHVGLENVPDMLDLRVGDRLGSGAKLTSWRTEEFKERLIEVQKEPFTVTDLKINGRDVMKTLNIEPGPRVGKILEEIFKKVDKKELPNERKKLLAEVTKETAKPSS